MNDISDCPICMNTLEKDISNNYINVAITSCGHIFCLSCIVQHSRIKFTCPMCRNNFLDPQTFKPINDEEMIESDMQDGWTFTSWAQQLQEINSRSITMNTLNGIPIQNLSLDVDPPDYFNISTSNYFANIEEAISPMSLHYIASDFLEPEPESEPESEPEPNIIDELEINNQIYDYSITISSPDDNNL